MGNLVDELLAALRTITELKHVAVWNNQFAYMEEGLDYSFPMPCAFLELDTSTLDDIGNGFEGSDINIIIHLGQNVLNSDYIEQNLTIFALRDLVIKKLKTFQGATTGLLSKDSEQQDFDHSNVYHYVIGYSTHFIDTTTAPDEYFTTPPTVLGVEATAPGQPIRG